MVTPNFENFSKMIIQNGLALIPEGKLEVINPIDEEQEAKGLVPMMTKSGEIIWVHPDIIKDEQWESSKLKLKGKSYNIVSLVMKDDAMIVASLSDSEEEKFAFTMQLATSQSIGTRSGK